MALCYSAVRNATLYWAIACNITPRCIILDHSAWRMRCYLKYMFGTLGKNTNYSGRARRKPDKQSTSPASVSKGPKRESAPRYKYP